MPDLAQQSDVTTLISRLQGLPGLASLISTASVWIQNYTGLQFVVNSYSELHDGKSESRIWLRQTPVLSVQSVILWPNTTPQPIDNTDNDGWTFDPATGELRRGNGHVNQRFEAWFPDGLQNVQVNYTAGAPSVPAPVLYATVLTVKHLADSLKMTGLLKSEDIGDYSYEMADAGDIGLPPLARVLLAPYIQDFIA
ncbi:MAG TPA: hypothetical protein VN719_09655 [Gemmatimonadales bacterium]|nr:hypothetical protein [Gemmatimonadales bacterium]